MHVSRPPILSPLVFIPSLFPSSLHVQALEQYLQEDTVSLPVQVNGKVRATIAVAIDADEAVVRELALGQENVQRAMGDKSVRKVIYVKGRILNLVVK